MLFLFPVIEIFSEACQRLFSLKNSDGGVLTPGGWYFFRGLSEAFRPNVRR